MGSGALPVDRLASAALSIRPKAGRSGTVDLTIQATAYDASTVSRTFTVTILPGAVPADLEPVHGR